MAEVNDNSSIQLFEDQKIRTAWDAEKEEWYFSIVDCQYGAAFTHHSVDSFQKG